MMRFLCVFGFLLVFLTGTMNTARAEDAPLKYYMDYEEALRIVPQDETIWFGKQHDIDLLQKPIPWAEQVRNAVTNAHGSDTEKRDVRALYAWVPMDKIPGEDNFPLLKRMNLAAQRGYQREMVASGAYDDGKEMARIAAQHKAIADEARAGILAEKEAMDADFAQTRENLQASINAAQARDLKAAQFEEMCWQHFDRNEFAGCDVVGSAMGRGALYQEANPARGHKATKYDVEVGTPAGTVILSPDESGWIAAYKKSSNSVTDIIFKKAR